MSQFYKPNSLQDLPASFSPDDTAFVVVDLQPAFFDPAACGSPESDKVARKISSFLPVVRDSGIPVYLVYHNVNSLAEQGFYRIAPDPRDHLVSKTTASAFPTGRVMTEGQEVGGLTETFNKRGVKNLIVCGGWLGACEFDTVVDALQAKFNTTVVDNLSVGYFPDEDTARSYKAALQKHGAQVTSAATVYKNIKNGMKI